MTSLALKRRLAHVEAYIGDAGDPFAKYANVPRQMTVKRLREEVKSLEKSSQTNTPRYRELQEELKFRAALPRNDIPPEQMAELKRLARKDTADAAPSVRNIDPVKIRFENALARGAPLAEIEELAAKLRAAGLQEYVSRMKMAAMRSNGTRDAAPTIRSMDARLRDVERYIKDAGDLKQREAGK